MAEKKKIIEKTLTGAKKLGVGKKIYEKGQKYTFTEDEWSELSGSVRKLFSEPEKEKEGIRLNIGTLRSADGGGK
jgi:hypothetical protein